MPCKRHHKRNSGNDRAHPPEKRNRLLHRRLPGVGIIYTFEGKDYIVTAAAYDGYGYAKREILKETLALLLFSGLTALIIVGYLLARSALAPIRSIVKEAENITASRINKRLPVKNEKDELGELSLTFNALLDRLEKVIQFAEDVCQQRVARTAYPYGCTFCRT